MGKTVECGIARRPVFRIPKEALPVLQALAAAVNRLSCPVYVKALACEFLQAIDETVKLLQDIL
jgi:hypothetical protein